MAATVEIRSFHGSGPTDTAWPSNGLFDRSDTDPTGTTSNPLLIPGSGTNYSWTKYWKLKFVTSPTGNATNLRAYGPNADVATGVKMYMGKKASYIQPNSGDESALLSTLLDLNGNYTSGSPLTINSGTVITNPSTGFGTQDYLALQAGVGTTASLGTTTGFTVTYRWDET